MTDSEPFEVVVEYSPCNCGAMKAKHYHLGPRTVVEWEVFKREMLEKLSKGKLYGSYSMVAVRNTDG
jgi:hypothetical protein